MTRKTWLKVKMFSDNIKLMESDLISFDSAGECEHEIHNRITSLYEIIDSSNVGAEVSVKRDFKSAHGICTLTIILHDKTP